MTINHIFYIHLSFCSKTRTHSTIPPTHFQARSHTVSGLTMADNSARFSSVSRSDKFCVIIGSFIIASDRIFMAASIVSRLPEFGNRVNLIDSRSNRPKSTRNLTPTDMPFRHMILYFNSTYIGFGRFWQYWIKVTGSFENPLQQSFTV